MKLAPCFIFSSLVISVTASATSPSLPPMVTTADYNLAEKLKVAVAHGDLREVQSYFTNDVTMAEDGLEARSTKQAVLDSMNNGYLGNWAKTTCGAVKVERTAVSRLKIVLFVSFPGGSKSCDYPAKANQIQIFRLNGDLEKPLVKNIDFWTVYG